MLMLFVLISCPTKARDWKCSTIHLPPSFLLMRTLWSRKRETLPWCVNTLESYFPSAACRSGTLQGSVISSTVGYEWPIWPFQLEDWNGHNRGLKWRIYWECSIIYHIFFESACSFGNKSTKRFLVNLYNAAQHSISQRLQSILYNMY